MVRIKDIAKEANVSEGTVDRVLHGRGGVSKKTADKINKILERRNFSINPVASALATKNNHTIAVLIPEYSETDSFWKLPYLGLLKASEDVKNIGLNVNYFKFDQYNSNSYMEAFTNLIKMKPSAVILVPMFLKETRVIINELKKAGTKYIFLNVDVEGEDGSVYIGQDSYMSGYIAGKLMKLSLTDGYDCCIMQASTSTGDNQAIVKRIKGFKDYYTAIKEEIKLHELKVESFGDEVKLASSVTLFLEKFPNIKGIFVPSSRVSAVVKILSEEQKESLQLIGFDNTPQNVVCLKNDTVLFLISQKPFDQGYEAVRLISDYLIKSKALKRKLYLPIDILTKENVDYNDANQLMFESDLKYQ
ncbi:substrate-binding domain-containing protein [Mariniflexile litorale]|uniref:Substrate-binding domain-containing protein n=1 Tax=Mariniflexile litorale TaxID=3045158 RepID=A0AAU7EBQ4_9FLAO|nr:substrate-binding domain-containing protein [Mariniflexile sp. KMM 9835]MDQ8213088.1 substrate-binding domain-containing protein [Mariniflexile sp. KMM 9835]